MSSRHQEASHSSSESFKGLDGEDNASSVDMQSEDDDDVDVKLDTATLSDDKDSDEEDLERFVLGNKASFRDQLFRDDLLYADSTDLVKGGQNAQKAGTGLEGAEDAAFFALDTGRAAGGKALEQLPDADGLGEEKDAPAWEDSDDERLTVSLASATRLRKLRTTEADDLVSGTEYARRLRQQYLRLYPAPEWAKDAAAIGKHTKGRRLRSSASNGDSSDASEEDSDEDETPDSAAPLESFLRDVNSFNGASARKRRKLRPETIDIQRTRDVPDSHKAPVSSLTFHPRHPILLSSSTSSIMYLHQFDPAAHPTPNPSLASVQVKQTDLRRTAFVGHAGDEIIFAGRRRYFHTWNLSTGIVRRISQIQGHQKEHRTMEHFRISPCGRYMALAASSRKGGGLVNILNVSTMQWIAQARLNGRHGVADFAWWRSGDGLAIAGRDGQVTEWSMLTKRAVGVWRDEGSIGGTVLALGGRNGPAGLGGDRWVVVGSTSGILNIYDRNNLVVEASSTTKESGEESSGGQEKEKIELQKLPEPTRVFEQLTTPITVVTFSPDGQLMAFGSQHKKDALRIVHLPSCTVYRNWPTEQTPLGRVTTVAFSAQSEVLAVGNDAGKIRMWEIRD
jgi:U3 small nucleolar RNA-associated protein 18